MTTGRISQPDRRVRAVQACPLDLGHVVLGGVSSLANDRARRPVIALHPAGVAGSLKGATSVLPKQRPLRDEYYVHGHPAPQGSKHAMRTPGTGRIYLKESAGIRLAVWRQTVSLCASERDVRFNGPVVVHLGFYLPRPKKHFGKHGITRGAPRQHYQTPDVDKLVRAVLDGLTIGRQILDDKYVVELHANKWWCDDGEPGCKVHIEATV